MDSFELPTGELHIPHNDISDSEGHITLPDEVAANEPAAAPEKPRRGSKGKARTQPEATDNAPIRAVPTLRQIFAEGRLRMFIGTVIILVAAYMCVAMISYIATGTEDQSVVVNHSMAEIQSSPSTVENAGGKFGAFFANFFINNWLGISAIILIIYALLIGLAVLRKTAINFWRMTFKALASTIALSILLGGVTYTSVSPTFWGGRHGYYVTEFFYNTTAFWGTLCIDLIMLSAIVFIFLGPISRWSRRISAFIGNYREKLKARYNQSIHSDDRRQEAPSQHIEETHDESVTGVSVPKTEIPAEPTDSATAPYILTDIPSVTVAPAVQPQPDTETPVTSNDVALDPLGFEVAPYSPSDSSATPEKPALPNEGNTGEADMIVVGQGPIEQADSISSNAYDPTAELSRYRFPSIDLLHERENTGAIIDEAEQEENKKVIINSLRSYGVEISSIKATVGPTITLYEIVPAEGVRIAKIKRLGDDMTLSLAAIGIRIIAPIPGKGTIGMEVPNKKPQTVSIRSILSSKAYQETKAELPMAMGSTITNEVYVADLAKMPHLLVAGATGMGKSVGLNTIIASLLYKKHPAELKFVLVDPKMVEFSLYKCLERHFLAKLPEEEEAIITDPSKVVATLNSLCVEMDNRYALLSKAGMRGIKEYNQKFISRQLNPEKGHRYLPYIVVIIDEFADLITTAGKDVETPISRIAAKARAVGIHMILATQRPSVNVITGVIKANFPGRMAFRVTQMNDSRTILDRPGAEQLIGRGDMLISRDGMIERVQCAFIDTDEVQAMCKAISDQMGYPMAYELPDYVAPGEGGASGGTGNAIADRDPLFADAGRAIIESGTGSTSYLQRKYNIGYPRAGKIMDQLEAAGVVGAALGGKPRSVIMDMYTFERYLESI